MKKRLFFLSVLLILTITGCAQKKDEDVTYYISRTMIVQGTGDINLREHTYDERWNPLTATISLNGNFSSKTEYIYSEDYTVVTQNSTSAIYEPDSTTIIRTFDEKGQVITAETYDGDRHVSTVENTYDDAGNILLSVQRTPDSGMIITMERTFDRKGNLLTQKTDTGYSTSRQEYIYDHQNRRIREEYYLNDVLTAYSEFRWTGSTAHGTNYSPEGIAGMTMMLIYDDFGNVLVNEIKDANGNLQSCTYNEYIGTDGSISSGISK